jgi:4-carboxymuconolactone decarboxylase
MSHSKDLFDTGLKIRQEVVGEDYVDRAIQNGSSEFAFPGQQLVTE